uniref:General transcription factor IIH subunit 4 n=1 Tax=Spongospora subterranea TaxID=70186 RepID=A0A0H5R850_9EUKA|eukprot:CRZ10298.1 hypothetical protein [Spongospora subterranea]
MEAPVSIMDYLSSTDSGTLDSLYADQYTCLAVFRSLSRVAKQCICRLMALCPGQVIHENVLKSWVRSRSIALYNNMLNDCHKLHLLNRVKLSDDEFVLNENFHRAMYASLLPVEINVDALADDPKPPSLDQLSATADTRWDMILHFMVGSKRFSPPSKPVQNLLKDMDLIGVGGPTSSGFKFLFKDLYTQLWTILIGYIRNLERRKMSRHEVLSFLFRLGFLELGKGYSVRLLTKSQKTVVDDLFQFGLIHRDEGSQFYYPTSLAISLSSGTHCQETNFTQDRFIIVETTFKVYAYTTSPLQIALLNMFAGLEAKLPNVVVGRITKKTVSKALGIGIGAEEIIAFLRDYAHPASLIRHEGVDIVENNSQVAPPDNVADQLRLWEAERNRLKYMSAALFRQFKDRDEYQSLLSYGEGQSFIVWKSDEKMMFITKKEHIDSIRNHINQLRTSAGS